MWSGLFNPNFAKAKFPKGTFVEDFGPSGTIVVEYDYGRSVAIEGTLEDFNALRAVGFPLARVKSFNSLYSEAWFTPDDDRELQQLKAGIVDQSDVTGSFFVKGVIFSGQTDTYEFFGTYQDYEAFAMSGFSKKWLMKFGMDNRQGDWGWPWGRDHDVYFIEEIGEFRTK